MLRFGAWHKTSTLEVESVDCWLRNQDGLDVLLYFAIFSEKDCSTLLRMSWLAVYFEVRVTLGHDAKCLPARFDNFEVRPCLLETVDEL